MSRKQLTKELRGRQPHPAVRVPEVGFNMGCRHKSNMKHPCPHERVCTGDRCFLTPDVVEGVVRLAELQQTAVFVQFTDERQKTEEQPVGSFFILLLLDLQDKVIVDELRHTGTRSQPKMGQKVEASRLRSWWG